MRWGSGALPLAFVGEPVLLRSNGVSQASAAQNDPREIATEIAGPAIGHFERNGRFGLGELREIGILQNRLAHWRPKPWGQYLGTRPQPGGVPS